MDKIKIEKPENWQKAVNFVPKLNQIIVYDGKMVDGQYVTIPKIKIGDGIHTVSELPFAHVQSQVTYLESDAVLVIEPMAIGDVFEPIVEV